MATFTIKTNDSMLTIQRALSTPNSTVKFTKGTYKITRQLVISSGVTVDLNGATLQRYGNIQSVFINHCLPTHTKYNADGSITIKNGTIEGMGKFSKDNLVTLFHSHDVVFYNVSFVDNLCHAIEINSTKNCVIRNCKFLGANLDDDYKEATQFDFAYAGGFYLAGSTPSSKCYDGTGACNVEISYCTFDKSNSRGYYSTAIGCHASLTTNSVHKNISIHHNTFRSLDPNDKTLPAINVMSMSNVVINDNTFIGFGRLARIMAHSYVYDLNGKRVVANKRNGISSNIVIENNTYSGQVGSNRAMIYSVSKSGSSFKNIIIRGNKFTNVVAKYFTWLENVATYKCEDEKLKLYVK